MHILRKRGLESKQKKGGGGSKYLKLSKFFVKMTKLTCINIFARCKEIK